MLIYPSSVQFGDFLFGYFWLQERQSSREGSTAPCLFRISSEGLPLILPHISNQILYASPIDFKHLLKYKSIKFPDFVDPSLREKAAELILGCCVVILRAGSHNILFMKKDVRIHLFCATGRNNWSNFNILYHMQKVGSQQVQGKMLCLLRLDVGEVELMYP